MNAVNVPVTSIESSCLSQESTIQSASSSKSESSFDSLLELAQKKLKSGMVPWSQFETLFGITPLNFDFDLNLAQIEDQLNNYRSREPQTSPPDQSQLSENALASPDLAENEASAKYFESDLKVIKEVLQNYIPLPYLGSMPFLPGSGLGSNSFYRSSLQSIIDEMMTQADFFKSSGKTQLSFTLSEKDLGEILISLINKQGSLSIQINANADTKKMLEDNLRELQTAFQKAHLNISQIKVVEVKKDGDRS